MSATRGGWDTEIARLHETSPGITETVLSRAVSHGTTPYEWLMEGAGSPERVLDLGCGSAPMCTQFEGRWVGLDASRTELVNAGNHARGPSCLRSSKRCPFDPTPSTSS